MLQHYDQETDLTSYLQSSKLAAWRITLIRKGYLTSEDKVTELGKSLLIRGKIDKVIAENKAEVKKAVAKIKTDFDKWWEAYPSSNYFVHRGVEFKGIQSKRIKKPLCKQHFQSFVDGGLFTAEEIIRATEFHIAMAKDMSVNRRDNQLSFIPNSERYLREQFFVPFIGKIAQPTKRVGGTVDI